MKCLKIAVLVAMIIIPSIGIAEDSGRHHEPAGVLLTIDDVQFSATVADALECLSGVPIEETLEKEITLSPLSVSSPDVEYEYLTDDSDNDDEPTRLLELELRDIQEELSGVEFLLTSKFSLAILSPKQQRQFREYEDSLIRVERLTTTLLVYLQALTRDRELFEDSDLDAMSGYGNRSITIP